MPSQVFRQRRQSVVHAVGLPDDFPVFLHSENGAAQWASQRFTPFGVRFGVRWFCVGENSCYTECGVLLSLRSMSDTLQFDEVRFKASTAIFKLGYREYDHGLTVREKKLPRGWVESPDKPDCMINPERLRRAIRYFDICLELWPDLAGDDGNACTVLNLKALTLRALGDFRTAAKAHAEVLATAKSMPMQEISQEGIKYCNERLKKS